MRNILGLLQPIGRALMLPIAVLPVAGLLLRLGQPDLLDINLLAAAGDALFSSLGLLFAVGVATGIARDGNGAASLAGVVCYLVTMHGGKALLPVPPEVTAGLADSLAQTVGEAWKSKAFARLDVPVGIVAGLFGGSLYNRFSTIAVPAYLAFFGGRRFVPIVAGGVGVVLAAGVGLLFPVLDAGLDHAGRGLVAAGPVGLFAFGVLNRLLLVTGLHHILNNIAWFVLGDFNGTTGDLRRFFAGDPGAGVFMSGFFPVMMFGLPAACLAMYRTARPEQRKATAGMLLSLALTSFLTGVTEPIEFSFMFLAPVLYGIHALLTGAAMVLMDLLGVRMGFGFSAGLFDYVLNFGRSTRPLLLIPVGLAYFAIYYAVFSFAIRRFDLATPGRQAAADGEGDGAGVPARGGAYLDALGGAANLSSIGACTTRLRLVVRDPAQVDDGALKALGAVAVLRPAPDAVQVIIGPIADRICAEMVEAAKVAPPPSSASPLLQAAPTASAGPVTLRADLLAALGGSDALEQVSLVAGRVRVRLRVAIDPAGLAAIEGLRCVATIDARTFHLIGQDLTV
ncbi:PTS system N-acetylglucosamine-specific IIB component, Glc family /PTS system N-acetylglucosamine-specific IIC component, Glc family [Novosphingobium sp. CF614]|uniref:N-acetylglucosamine-specific PTS transporter subunit IIBC n=1 Tax=Novosphingobium sp. CF614 TaxID=1884364 RepID=UPI0008F2CFAE|nr:N-acetylglucosamine-specific PTS transporter subunit IIBC [Novosphingobium sp. CF614]SFF72801.1 PTS system N-acetylglucosamine-specific IIB component, Glc family /PTS system N-acetylglucosamine-specific IIC component, Glc family [Novosphingobium sp. CF614]